MRHRRIRLAVLASFVLHLLVLWMYLRWVGPDRLHEMLRPIRFETTPGIAQQERRRDDGTTADGARAVTKY
ncbi:MAG TPA: hypothetical protein DIC52_17385 [Candidatus Latescibacteria bacterium]|nr:hypothetical protein [Candidatus Latescibacterota bacterium]